MFKLRPHQKKQNKATLKALKHHNHILYGMATGGGKSVCMYDLIEKFIGKGKRVLVLAPFRKLVFQLEKTFTYLQPHVVMGNIDRGNVKSGLILSSLDTMNNRIKKGSNYFNDIDIIIGDEVHISYNFPPKKGSRMETLYNMYWDSAKFIGFTATPITSSGYRLEGWDKTIYKYQTEKLIKMGFLVDYDYYAPVDLDLSDLRVASTGEYVLDDVEEVTNTATAIDSVKKVWKDNCKNKKVLIFAASIKHAELLQKAIEGSMVVHSKLSDKQQMQILNDFENSSWGTLINVNMLIAGFDSPSVDTMIIARPIKSISNYIQCAGRVLRLDPANKSKKATIYDMCSCYKSCGLPSDRRDFNKVKKVEDIKKKDKDEDEISAMKCALCDEVSPRADFKVKKKTTKKSITTKYWCPVCGKLCKESRQDLSEIKKMQKVKKKKIKKLNYADRKVIVSKLVTEFTKSNPKWSHYILTIINKADKSELLDQAIAKGTTDKTLWKKIMKLYEDSKNV
ncbi:DNA helicase [Thiohalocapsa phage LS06-2018-MD03]|nr:DNA helicase [Thiohalocapsa phage LS06-2018-MD03]